FDLGRHCRRTAGSHLNDAVLNARNELIGSRIGVGLDRLTLRLVDVLDYRVVLILRFVGHLLLPPGAAASCRAEFLFRGTRAARPLLLNPKIAKFVKLIADPHAEPGEQRLDEPLAG